MYHNQLPRYSSVKSSLESNKYDTAVYDDTPVTLLNLKVSMTNEKRKLRNSHFFQLNKLCDFVYPDHQIVRERL